MAGKCEPPKSVFVRAYERLAGRRRRKRKAPAGPYYTCVQAGTGETCGKHHQKLATALTHTKRLNREERARAARFTTTKKRVKAKLWDPERRNA